MWNFKHLCPLCNSASEVFFDEQFFKCTTCHSIFRSSKYFLSPEKEKCRYEEHNNDVHDTRYQNFVTPLVERICKNHIPSDIGLDFWAGTWPVITHLLQKQWYKVNLYDPFFHNDPNALEKRYNFIVVCEVIEHFHHPKKEFQKLYNLLNIWGKLYIKTDTYNSDIDFWGWYYKNDPTHVFFYSTKTFLWIQKNLNWKKVETLERVTVFEK